MVPSVVVSELMNSRYAVGVRVDGGFLVEGGEGEEAVEGGAALDEVGDTRSGPCSGVGEVGEESIVT